MPYNSTFKDIHHMLSSFWVCICGYFYGTEKYVVAFLLSFLLNLFAGLKVAHFKIYTVFFWRLLKKIIAEGLLILIIILMLHQICILMIHSEPAIVLTRISIGIAVFFYIKNAVRSLSDAYPDIIWLKFILILLTMSLKKHAPKDIQDAVDEAEHKQTDHTDHKSE